LRATPDCERRATAQRLGPPARSINQLSPHALRFRAKPWLATSHRLRLPGCQDLHRSAPAGVEPAFHPAHDAYRVPLELRFLRHRQLFRIARVVAANDESAA